MMPCWPFTGMTIPGLAFSVRHARCIAKIASVQNKVVNALFSQTSVWEVMQFCSRHQRPILSLGRVGS